MARRDIATKWTCSRSGDCCLTPALVCTGEEVAAMQAARYLPLTVVPLNDKPGLVRIDMPGGCPYLAREIDGKSVCTIYEARPYQCRRFMCLRPDPETEPYEWGGRLGCQNLSDRVDDSLHALTFYQSNQRRAQTWAKAHGWRADMT